MSIRKKLQLCDLGSTGTLIMPFQEPRKCSYCSNLLKTDGEQSSKVCRHCYIR